MAGKKRSRSSEPLEFRNTQLADALQTQDMAALAFALRHGPTVVPLLRPGQRDDPRDSGEVWTYRDPKTGDVALLLFSDAVHKPAALPPAVALQSPAQAAQVLAAKREGTQALLRVFGTGGRGSCASTAALPLGPLDADGARAAKRRTAPASAHPRATAASHAERRPPPG